MIGSRSPCCRKLEFNYSVGSKELKCLFVSVRAINQALTEPDIEIPRLRNMSVFKKTALQVETNIFWNTAQIILERVQSKLKYVEIPSINSSKAILRKKNVFIEISKDVIEGWVFEAFNIPSPQLRKSIERRLLAFFEVNLEDYDCNQIQLLKEKVDINCFHKKSPDSVKTNGVIHEPEPEIFHKSLGMKIDENISENLEGRMMLPVSEFKVGLKNLNFKEGEHNIPYPEFRRRFSNTASETSFDQLSNIIPPCAEYFFSLNLQEANRYILTTEETNMRVEETDEENREQGGFGIMLVENLKNQFTQTAVAPDIHKTEGEHIKSNVDINLKIGFRLSRSFYIIRRRKRGFPNR